ncbi:MAG TPA: hypothetical protein VEQ34_12065, partial [Pyrinomonadaceae bacterium]|nr:hypothetical protein [Pyrinomonadaceae bacterium]
TLCVKLLLYSYRQKHELLFRLTLSSGCLFQTESKILEAVFNNSQDAARFARSCLRAKPKVKSQKAKGAELNL